MKAFGYGTQDEQGELSPVTFDRKDVRDGEVEIEITHCGVCHSDLHQARGDWGNTVYPCVPGHEVVGQVTAIGHGVTRFRVGQTVGVGCMVNSCQTCEACKSGEEQYCSGPKSCTLTYNGPKKPDGTNSYGGYSTGIIVREEFVVPIPDAIDPAHAAPILCAGVTTYSPMKHWNLKEGQDARGRRHRRAWPYGRTDRKGTGREGHCIDHFCREVRCDKGVRRRRRDCDVG